MVARLLVGDDVCGGHTVEGDARQRGRIALRVTAPANGVDGAIEHDPVSVRKVAARLGDTAFESSGR